MNLAGNGRVLMVIDGQFGSTGKGLISGWIALHNPPDIAVSCASANAGHTFIDSNHKIVAKHLPISGIITTTAEIYLGAGSIIDPDAFLEELKYVDDPGRVSIHPRAAVITSSDKQSELGPYSNATRIASTQQGVGEALIRKIGRGAMLADDHPFLKRFVRPFDLNRRLGQGARVILEVPQGLGLGINSGYMYPYVTSREIGVAQALADAQIHPSFLGEVVMSCRTYPIRVGNIYEQRDYKRGWSGPFYPDSKEISWEDLGVSPEMTTVTKRVRRVATFSVQQYEWAISQIQPTQVFLNFVEYLKSVDEFLEQLDKMSPFRKPALFGIGPTVNDIYPIERTPIMFERLGWK